MEYIANINQVSETNPDSYTKIIILQPESMDTVIAKLVKESGRSFKVTLKDALEVYSLLAAGRLTNSEEELAYYREHHDPLPAFSL